MERGVALPPLPPFKIMIFKVLFYRSDSLLFERNTEWLPICASSYQDAIDVFNKYYGVPFEANIIDVSIISYEDY